MKWSQSYVFTLKEAPSDAEITSHKLMVRGGYLKKIGPGIYTYHNFALRAIRKFENIIREELNKRGCTEILMPMVHPKELWEETNRWKEMGAGLLKFQNRNEQWYCLGATHEEVVTDVVRSDIKSYRDLPKNLYQIQTKYRDEIRPRFGLMRGREFIMKDAYSFDRNTEGALKSYQLMYEAYRASFDRLGLNYRVVEADAGNIGGSQTHEFQLLADAGEDHLMVCDTCDFAANIEVAPAIDANPTHETASELAAEEFATPGLKTIADLAKSLKVKESSLVKTMFFSASDDPAKVKPVAVLLRGSDEVNPVKLKNVLGLANPPLLLNDQEVFAVTGAKPGSCGPKGLKIPIYVDTPVSLMKNLVVGANKDDFHVRNINAGRDFQITKVADIRMAHEGDRCPKCKKGSYKSYRGIEVGHIFYLGTKYSKAMSATYLNEEGKAVPIEMGCYGIGVTRTVQAAIEQQHDQDGIIWPKSIAPFHVHICLLDPTKPEVAGPCEKIYQDLQVAGLDVFVDDRDERPGVKFKDADLLGMPIRLNIGGKGIAAGEIEIVIRKTKEMIKVPLAEAVTKIKSLI